MREAQCNLCGVFVGLPSAVENMCNEKYHPAVCIHLCPYTLSLTESLLTWCTCGDIKEILAALNGPVSPIQHQTFYCYKLSVWFRALKPAMSHSKEKETLEKSEHAGEREEVAVAAITYDRMFPWEKCQI